MISTAVWSRSMVLRSAICLLLSARRPRDALTVPHHPPRGRRPVARAPLRQRWSLTPLGLLGHRWPSTRACPPRAMWTVRRGQCTRREAQALLSRAASPLSGVAQGAIVSTHAVRAHSAAGAAGGVRAPRAWEHAAGVAMAPGYASRRRQHKGEWARVAG